MFYNSPMEQFVFVPFSFAQRLPTFSSDIFIFSVPVFFILFILWVLSVESGSIKGFTYSGNIGFLNLVAWYFDQIQKFCERVLGPVNGYRFYPLFSCVFFVVLFLNLMGMMPFTFNITSQLSCTFSLAFSLLSTSTYLLFKVNGKRGFSLFYPKGLPFYISVFLIPLEVMSYCLRYISLPLRLFTNMMAGHILIKVFLSIISALIGFGGFSSFLACFIPLLLLVFLIALEILIALVQAYVFCLLMLTFFNEIYSLN
jgi:ATP synthase subunit 6